MLQLDPNKKKQLDSNIKSMLDNGASQEDVMKYATDFKEKFSEKKKDGTNSNSTSTSDSQKLVSAPKNGSSGTTKQPEYEYKPIKDERGREVYEKDAFGNLVPKKEKVLKGYASSTEEREIVREEVKQKALKPIKTSVNLQKYEEATKPTEQEVNEKITEIEDEINQKGFGNGFSTGLKKGANFLSDVFTTIGTFGTQTTGPNFDLNPYSKEQEQAKRELTAEFKGDTSKFSDEDILSKTKQIVLNKKIEGLKIDKNNSFLSNLSENDKRALELEKIANYKTITAKDKYLATEASILINETEKNAKDYNVVKAIVLKNNKEGKQTPKELLDYGIEIEGKLRNAVTQATELENKIAENRNEIGSTEEEIDFLKRNYSMKDKFITNVKLGFGDIYMNLGVKQELAIGDAFGVIDEERKQEIIDQSIDWENAKQIYKNKESRDISFENLGVNNFGEFFFQELGTQVPIFAQIAMPGGVTSIGLTSAFDKYSQMVVEDKKDDKINYDKLQMISTAIGFGASEAVLGALPTKGILSRSVRSFEQAGQRQLLRESGKQYLQRKGIGIIESGSMEAVTEGLTQVTQNLLDKSILGKKEIGLFDNVDHAAFSGGMLGGAMTMMPTVAGLIIKPFSENKQSKEINENLQMIFNLQEQLDNNSIEGTSRQVIQDKISSLETRNKEVLTSIANKTKGISEEVFNAIVDVNKKQEILRIKATEINADPNIDKKLKDQLISDLESQFNALETKRGVLVSDKVTVLDALSESESTKLKQQAAAELISKAKSEGKTDEQINFTEEEVNKKAIEIYNQSKPNATQQEATTTETKQEAQPQAEAQAEVGEVETNEQKIAKLEAELETITDDNNPRIAEIDAEIEALESEPQRNPINEIPPPPEGFDIVSEKKPAPSQVDNIDKNIEPIVEPINNDNANQNAQQNNEGRNIETKKVTSTKVRNPKTGEFANFDVDIENGNVVEIRNPKTGRIIPEFVEIVNKKTKKVTIKKNANWTSIEADALGLESESKIKEINKNILSNFIPTTAYQAALDFFARGGKVSLESIKYETGNTDSKWATNQSNQEGLSSIESVSENISMKNPNLDQQEIRGELIEVISSFNNVQEVKDEIINTNSENKRIEQEQEARAIIGSLSPQEFAQYESIVAENFMFEEMSEEQIISYFENKYQEQQQYYETETGRQEANEPSGSVEGVSIQESVGETKTKEEQKVRITFGPFNEFADTGVLLSNGDVMLENGEIIKKNNIDSLENIDENQQLKPEQVEPNVDEKAKLDKLADFLKDIDKRLKDFGDETLGINLPVVVARAAIKAMQLAVATAQTAQEVIDAGLDAVKQSDWYKNLSNREQSDIDANLKDYLNKPFQNAPSEKTRLKIEQEIQERLDNNESKKNIIDSISDRREKMIAQDYIERQSNRSVPEVRKKIAESFEKADEALQDKKTTQEKIDKAFRNFITQIADRQFVPKFILNKAGGRLVRNYLIATKGATGYAKEMYDEAYAKIYKGLTSAEIKTLDKIIQLRRFIAIDENRAKNNMPDVVHPDFINANDVKIELAELEKELGTEKFKDLTKRADAYFDEFRGLLTEMQKSGLISKESLDMFFEIDYQPRMFLEFLQNNETDFVPETSSSSSLSSEQIRKLEEGLNTSLIYDSQYLLSRSMNIRAKSIAMNNTNKKLVEFIEKQAKVVEDLKNKTDKTQKEKDTIKYFEELSKRVKINPIVGFTDTGNPKYKYALPKNFKNAYYYIDGVKHNVMMEEVFHEQYFDAAKGFLNGNTKEVVSMVSGTALVKAVATGNNPTFFITNTPRDFFFIATFSEEYGMSVLVNMAKLAKDAFNGVKDIKQGSDNYKNFIKYGGMMDFLKDQGKLKHTEIQKLFDKVDNKKREGFSKVFNAVTLSKLQIYSEVGFRMAVFNRSVKNQLKELGYSKIEDVKDQSVIDDVYTNAVASARGIMDFNQGGKITKDTDAFIPYLNAATQGTRVMVDNFRERPFETTFRTTQTAVLFSGAAIGTSIAMFSAFGDDDDEMTSTERYLYAKKGVSKYDQTNYFIVFTGQKTESGQYSYIRIAKPQQITPFFSMTDGMITSFIKAKIGDESPTDAIDNVKFAFSKNISPLEFSVTGNIARNPLLKSALSYSTGYDFYREEDLSYLRGKVPVPAEGFESKTVEDFYKKIGEETEMSPVRFKAAVESYITTPSTSPYIGFLYGGIDAMASDKEGKEVLNKLGKDLLKSTVNRLKKETTDFNRRLENNNALQKKMEQVEIENLKTKSLFKKYADAYTNKEMTISEISKELEEVAKENPFEAKRLKKMIKDKIKNKDISPYVFEIKYAKSAESKALMLIDLFGDDLKDISKLEPEEKKLLFQMKKIGAINKEVLFEYKRLVEESKKPTN